MATMTTTVAGILVAVGFCCDDRWWFLFSFKVSCLLLSVKERENCQFVVMLEPD